MSQQPPTSFTGAVAVDIESKLTPDCIEGILQDFRCWLEEAAKRASIAEQPPSVETEFSWQSLVAEFTALRQEVKLQTRATRTQLEQHAQVLQQLEKQAHILEEEQKPAVTEAQKDELLRPLLKTLVEAYDALALACREVKRVQKNTNDLASKATAEAPTRRWWQLWKSPAGRDIRKVDRAGHEQAQQVLASVLMGYDMGLQRLERALTHSELEPIRCLGEAFNPECMEVVDVVVEPGRQNMEVLEEVRPGYRWRGRLFRAAQVRVCRGEV
jgi:molecular chaperone GrpE